MLAVGWWVYGAGNGNGSKAEGRNAALVTGNGGGFITTTTSTIPAPVEETTTTIEVTVEEVVEEEYVPFTTPYTYPAPEPSYSYTPDPAPSSPSYGTGACGGDLPPCYVMERESGGDTTIYNHEGSGASGKWQFMYGTWDGYGGYENAADAPEYVQDQKAREVWAGGAGCSAWSAC